jgi:hypothetical protein
MGEEEFALRIQNDQMFFEYECWDEKHMIRTIINMKKMPIREIENENKE